MSYAVIPSIRVRDVPASLRFYTQTLGFELVRGGEGEANNSLRLGEANIMLEKGGDFYSPEYNQAIRDRMGGVSPNATYFEAPDLEGMYAAATAAGARIMDPLARRDWGQSEFTVEDPDGNWLTFWKATATG